MKVEVLKKKKKGGEREPRKEEKDKKSKIQKSWKCSCLRACAFGPIDKTQGLYRI